MWVEERVTIRHPQGLHVRPARMLWETARRFPCEVRVVKGHISADVKSIFEIMTLDASDGAEILVRAKGDQAEEAVRAIVRLIDDGFPETMKPAP